MPRLSIVIPVQGSTALFEAGIVSVLQHRPDDSEVIVVLTSEYDDPYDLRDEDVRFVHAGAAHDWLSLANRGLAVAGGEVVHLLACGAEVCEGWADLALAHFDDPSVAAVAPMVVGEAHPERILTAGVRFSSGGVVSVALANKKRTSIGDNSQAVLGPQSVAAFYRTAALSRAGDPFDVLLGPALADVDLALRLTADGARAVLEPRAVVSVPQDALHCEPAGREQSRRLERLYWRHLPRSGRAASLARHALVVLGEALVHLFTGRAHQTLAGRCLGAFDALRGRARTAPLPAASTTDSVRALRIDQAQRAERKRAIESSRPLRRSA